MVEKTSSVEGQFFSALATFKWPEL